MKSSTSQAAFRLGAILILVASILVIAVILIGVANYFGVLNVFPSVPGEPAARSVADDVTVVFSAAGLLVAICTVWAAFETISRQQQENRRQRQMETLHLINTRYDDIFDDVFRLMREAKINAGDDGAPKVDASELDRIYNRYFTTIMTEFRYYRLGLVPREDFVDWTTILINRFRDGRCITGRREEGRNMMVEKWKAFDAFLPGPREHLRAYMSSVMAAAGLTPEVHAMDAEGAKTARAAGVITDAVPPSRKQ